MLVQSCNFLIVSENPRLKDLIIEVELDIMIWKGEKKNLGYIQTHDTLDKNDESVQCCNSLE